MLWGAVAAVLLFLLRDPALTAKYAYAGVRLAVFTVLPSTFPYMILSGFLLSMGLVGRGEKRRGKLFAGWFRLPSCAAAVVAMGLISGFPVGASMTAGLYESGQLEKEEAEALLACCNFCGPPFLIGVIGAGILGSAAFGWLLWGVQSVFSLLWLLGGRKKREPKGKMPEAKKAERSSAPRFGVCFYAAVKNACASMLLIGGFVVFFSIFTGITGQALMGMGAPGWLRTAVAALLELSSGTAAVGGTVGASFSGCFFLALTAAWSGFSVHLQISAFALPAGLSMKRYYRTRLLLAPLIALAAALLSRSFL